MPVTKTTKAPIRFLELLDEAMKAHPDNLSLREVARRADISPAYLSRLLSGERGAPSNDAIKQLERVLNIPDKALFRAADRAEDQILEFFRKDEGGSIVRKLASLPKGQLTAVNKMIERFLQKQLRTKVK